MLNLIRADIYRLFRSKGFYIMLGLLVGYILLSVLSEGYGTSGVKLDEIIAMQKESGAAEWTGRNTLITMSMQVSFLLYALLPVFVLTTGFDLSRQTYKNLLTAGVSRGKFFFSKYLAFLVMTLLLFVIYYGLSFTAATVKSGMGTIDSDFIEELLRTIGIQFLCIQGNFAFALFILFLSFSNIAAVLTGIFVPIITSILLLLLPKIDAIRYFAFQFNIDGAWMAKMPEHYWVKVAGASLVTIAVCCLGAYHVLKQKDL